MTSKADILGRAPIMRPLEKKHGDDWHPFNTEARGETETSFVPNRGTTYSGVREEHHFHKVSLPAKPWGDDHV